MLSIRESGPPFESEEVKRDVVDNRNRKEDRHWPTKPGFPCHPVAREECDNPHHDEECFV